MKPVKPVQPKRHKKPGPDTPYQLAHETRALVREIHANSQATLAAILQRLDALAQQGETIMSTLQDLKDAITQVATDIAAEKTEVQGKLAELAAQIKALQDQIAAGSPVTQADLDALVVQVQGIDAGVKDISEPAIP